jgi:acyl-coenzyme A thioesterase PaaI-like protein
MKKKVIELVDKLIASSDRKAALIAIEKIFNNRIPFNLPHKFKFLELTEAATRLKLPYKKVNQNHLGGMHACAITTLGEYPAGLSLIKRFGSSKYRLIMTKLEADYIKQAMGELVGDVEIDHDEFNRIEQELEIADKATIIMVTNIKNTEDEIVSVVQTHWQLKNWKSVSFNKN